MSNFSSNSDRAQRAAARRARRAAEPPNPQWPLDPILKDGSFWVGSMFFKTFEEAQAFSAQLKAAL